MSAQQPATKPPATKSLETKPPATQLPGPPQPEGQVTATSDRSRPLEGRWSVELFLDPLSIPNPPPAEKITGEVAFGSASWWTPTDRFGRYNVDTRPFFGRLYAAPANVPAFGAADTSLFTEASGGVIGDSVGIDFLPRLDHGGLSLWGRFYGDSARGKWHRRGADGGGRFLMRRVSKDAVAVAAIPIPGQPPVAVASTATSEKKSKKEIAAEKKAAAAQALAEKKAAAALALAEKKAAAAQALAVKKAAAAQTLAEKKTADSAKAALKNGATTVATNATTTNPSAMNPPATNSPATNSAVTSRPATIASTGPALTTAAVTSSPTPTRTTTTPTATAPTATAPAPKPATTAATVPKPPASDPAATGALRVRMFDRSSKKYFVSRYQLHLPDGSFKWGNFHSGLGEDGYGPVVSSRPGRYEVEVENFVCGDKFWFFAKPVVRPVLVKAEEVTDVTIDLDLSTEPAKKTIDNKTGALCAAGPGTLK